MLSFIFFYISIFKTVTKYWILITNTNIVSDVIAFKLIKDGAKKYYFENYQE